MNAEWYIRIACFGIGFCLCGLIFSLANVKIEKAREEDEIQDRDLGGD